jgi:signal transduction histidine kinase
MAKTYRQRCRNCVANRGARNTQRKLDEELQRRALNEMINVEPLAVVGDPTPPKRESDWMLATLRELQQAKDALRSSQDRYRALSRRLLELHERERRWLARELHDQLGQGLIAVSLTLDAVKDDLSPSSSGRVPESMRVIEQMLEQVRTLAFELRPSALDDLGMVAALHRLVVRHGERTGVCANFRATPADLRAPAEIETAIFRIVQEALTNVARHARASHVEVTLAVQDDALVLAVQDDGVGFDVGERLSTSLGLVGMSERAMLAGGKLEVESAPRAGTTLCARIPLPRRSS